MSDQRFHVGARALMHKSHEDWTSPFPRQNYLVTYVMGVPTTARPVRTAALTLKSAARGGEGLCGQALTQQRDTMNLGLGAASAVVSAPASPDDRAEALRCA